MSAKKNQLIYLAGGLTSLGLGMFIAGSILGVLRAPKHCAAAIGRVQAAECAGCDVAVAFRRREPPYNTIKTKVKAPPGVSYRSDVLTSVVVWYDPTNPKDAQLTPPPLVAWGGVALAVVGLLLMLGVCLAYAVYVRKWELSGRSVSSGDQSGRSGSAESKQIL